MLKWCLEGRRDLPVVTGVESAVGNTEKSSGLGIVSVFAIALEEGKGRQKVTFLQEVVGIWQSELLLGLKSKEANLVKKQG